MSDKPPNGCRFLSQRPRTNKAWTSFNITISFSGKQKPTIFFAPCCKQRAKTSVPSVAISQLTVAPRARGVRLHLGGRVWLQPPRIQAAGPRATPPLHPGGPAGGVGASVPQPGQPGCSEALQRTGRLHAGLDGTQRGNRPVREPFRAPMSHDVNIHAWLFPSGANEPPHCLTCFLFVIYLHLFWPCFASDGYEV